MINQLTINDYIRIIEEADYILIKHHSLYETAKKTKRPISLVNKDLIYDLALIDREKQEQVKAKLQQEKMPLRLGKRIRGIYYIKRI